MMALDFKWNRGRKLLALLVLLALSAGQALAEEKDPPAEQPAVQDKEGMAFFERKVRPVLVKHCYECHSADSDEIGGGLRLDTRQATLAGGESGPAVVPGKIAESLLIAAVEYRDLEMPPEGKLPEDVIADLRRWVGMGAPDPRVQEVAMPREPETKPGAESLWSLQPVERPEVPAVRGGDWARSDIDRFVLARLEQQELEPVADADPRRLLRRVYFDLVGLPPSPEDVRAFAADPTPEHYRRIVDKLLKSPRFGERWGRHWLDVVRYAESAGNSRDVLMPYAYRYRDYVIDALNRDVPYDRFVTEQLAGDLLPADSPEERRRLLVATGLLAVGSKSLNGGNLELDIADDQIDVVGKAVLGLTISCARCHDHKFDPIPTADYYALAGIFRSTETLYGGGTNRPKNVPEKLKVYLPLGEDAEQIGRRIEEREKEKARLTKQQAAAAKQVKTLEAKLPKNWKEKLAALEAGGKSADEAPDAKLPEADAASREVQPGQAEKGEAGDQGEASQPPVSQPGPLETQVARFRAAQQKLREIQTRLKQLNETPVPELEFAVGVRDKKKIADYPIQVRGERNRAGDVVQRGFLSCVELPIPAKVENQEQSGRLELARWLTHPRHPLTGRVLVNRVWQHLFGQGLVETVDNFGVNGMPPTHPQLLDWLADRFVNEHAWSLKSLVRELVMTRTYQLSTDYSEANYEVDPGNTLYWRMSRRRLEAEALRDAMLAASGKLVLDPPETSPVTKIGEGEVGRGINTRPLEEPFPHRSVYLPIIRGLVPEFLKLFDLPEPSNPQGQRAATNVPAQSLFLLNSPFVIEQAEGIAGRAMAAAQEDAGRLEYAYLLCLSRPPSAEELERGLAFLDQAQDNLAAEPAEDGKPRDGKQSAAPDSRLVPWTMLCQGLLASAEFRYLE